MQRDLDRLEQWTIINGMKFDKGRCWAALGWSNSGHRYRLGDEWLENGSAERAPGELLTAGSTQASSVPWQPKGQTIFWGPLNTA